MTFENISQSVNIWSEDRNIHTQDCSPKQLIKLGEEAGELFSAFLKGDRDGVTDAIGDCLVVLTIFCQQQDLNPVECFESAWNQIKNRKGSTVNGTFIKQENQ